MKKNISVGELKNLEKLVVDSPFHHENHSELTVTADEQVNCLLVFPFVDVSLVFVYAEIQVERVNFDFGFEASNWSSDRHLSIRFLIIDVLDNHARGLLNKWVAACKIIQLFERSFPLSDVTAYGFNEILFLLVKFSLDSNLRVW